MWPRTSWQERLNAVWPTQHTAPVNRVTAELAFDGVYFQERAARLIYDILPPNPSVLGNNLLEGNECR